MIKKLFGRYWPELTCILAFLLIASVYFAPLIGGKKVMFQHDIQQALGMAHEIELHKEKTGEQSLWTNSMFSGMPAYQIKSEFPNNWSAYIFSSITYMLGYDRYPITTLWLLMTCFFLMLLAFKVNVWVAAAVSLGYAFTTFNIIGIDAGHANKMWTLMYAPIIIAGIRMAFDKKYLAAGVITALGLAIQVYANHLQITYYLMITILVWMIVKLIYAIRENQLKDFTIACLVLIVGAAVGVSTNTSTLWTTYEYGKESTRGGSDLTLDSSVSSTGLDKDYVFGDYSYGHTEVLTFLIPNFSGGASTMDVGRKSELGKLAIQNQMPTEQPTYWGDQRYVAGPFYLGVILIFLMVVGLILSRRMATKIWLTAAGLLALVLSMGHNSMLSDLFYDYVPLYNKFRTPTMFTAITQLCIAVLAALGLEALWQRRAEASSFKKLNLGLYIVGGLCLFVALAGPSVFALTGRGDEQMGLKGDVLTIFQEHRADMMKKDAFRSLFLVVAAWLVLWAMLKDKLKAPLAMAILGLLMLGDQWAVNTRYMEKSYKKKTKTEDLYTTSVADKEILADKDPNYRVMNMSVSPFNDATTSYYHKSIGGYHGAKLRRYQELIEYHITPEMSNLGQVINSQNVLGLDSALKNMPVLNMLNTRYFILRAEGAPLRNPYANGNAWFVKEARAVSDANQEMLGLSSINTKETALVDASRWKDALGNFKGGSGQGTISLVSYEPNHLVYESQTSQEELAVFSEIYYPYGWKATIDGQPAEYFRCNFVLRCMKIPAGKHKVEFVFEPESYTRGESVSLAGSLLLTLVTVGSIGFGIFRLRRKAEAEA